MPSATKLPRIRFDNPERLSEHGIYLKHKWISLLASSSRASCRPSEQRPETILDGILCSVAQGHVLDGFDCVLSVSDDAPKPRYDDLEFS